MRRIFRLISDITVMSVLCLMWCSGCSNGPVQSPEHVSSAAATTPTKPGAEIGQTTDSSAIDGNQATGSTAAVENSVVAKAGEPEVTTVQQPDPAAVSENTPAEVPAEEKAAEKPKRKSIYDETANAQELIAKAVRQAKRDHKHVLIEWGGNWCGWCHLLHDCFTKVPEVSKIVHEEYVLVLIDSNSNSDLMKQYAQDHPIAGFPHLTVLNEEGTVLKNQDTEPLEKGKGHDPERVVTFLSEYMAPKVDAEKLVAEQMEHARQTGKRVLFRVGDPYCGWCNVLSRFIQDHESLFDKDYVNAKIDVMRMTNGESVAKAHRPENADGHPWFIILEPSGDVLATSVGPKGNIGYPGSSEEIAHFMKMLRDTRKSLTDDDLASIETDLNEFRIRREKKLAAPSAD
jgi:thioredoxin-related protein